MSAPEPYWADDRVTLYLGDCLDVLAAMDTGSVDAVVTDPPAGIAFMNREWDDFRRARNPADAGREDVFGRTSARGPEYGRGERASFVASMTAVMTEAVRVMKPGAHILVWAIPRTSHWTAWAIEDAGLQIRDCVTHLFGSGFPKSLDVSKAIDKAAGAERQVIGRRVRPDGSARDPAIGGSAATALSGSADGVLNTNGAMAVATAPATEDATEDAARWAGWGTALKPGQEMWWLARKPIRGTVAGNVLAYGTGALNVNGCRVPTSPEDAEAMERANTPGSGRMKAGGSPIGTFARSSATGAMDTRAGRWPANIVLTHSAACGGTCADDCPVGELDRQSGARPSGGSPAGQSINTGLRGNSFATERTPREADTGGASRFYPVFRYEPKAPAHERPRLPDGTAHETVKPLDLMRWLVRLVTPPDGTVLDCFAGSGTTGEACVVEGFQCVLIEKHAPYAELIRKRLEKPIQPVMFGGVA